MYMNSIASNIEHRFVDEERVLAKLIITISNINSI